ncbi:MAG: hypothetical protein WA900_14090 [Casimicrobiaceae bacterium]
MRHSDARPSKTRLSLGRELDAQAEARPAPDTGHHPSPCWRPRPLLGLGGQRYPICLADNRLRRLPRGFATYNASERETLAKRGPNGKEDPERDRRLQPDEETRIAAVLERRIAEERDSTMQALHRAALLMLRLALETCMRMREPYTLELQQVDIPRNTMFLTGTENGLCRRDSCGSHCDPET